MQAINFKSEEMTMAQTVGRREKRKIRRKIKFANFMTLVKEGFGKFGTIFLMMIIISMGSFILISEIQHKNFIINIEKDPHIPNSVVKRVISYIR